MGLENQQNCAQQHDQEGGPPRPIRPPRTIHDRGGNEAGYGENQLRRFLPLAANGTDKQDRADSEC
jgi:hypothetical protein